MDTIDEVKRVLSDVLQIDTQGLDVNTSLLGGIPEFDSMAVVAVITSLEENFGFVVEDDEIDADVFETLGSLVQFAESKIG